MAQPEKSSPGAWFAPFESRVPGAPDKRPDLRVKTWPKHGLAPARPLLSGSPAYFTPHSLAILGISGSSILLFCCVLLLSGIGYTVRKLLNAIRQLDEVNGRLARQARELASSNEQLKTEMAGRRRMEVELRASENFYFSLVETLPQSIFRKDISGRYTFANLAFCAILGKSAGEIIGSTDQSLFPADLVAKLRREDEQVLSSGKQMQTEQPIPTPDRGKISTHMIRTALFDSEGQPIGVQGIFWDVSDRKQSKNELESAHRQLVEASHRAGMAEVATGVLHNVGNVLNSVNVSATLVSGQVKNSKLSSLAKVAALLSEHADDATFLTEDERGKRLPGYLKDLSEHLRKEQAAMLNELDSLVRNIEHINEIVAMQQTYAKLSGLTVAVKASEIAEDALRMNSEALIRHEVQVVREYEQDPIIYVDKHKVLQTLVNLIRNAKHACDDSGRTDKQIALRIGLSGNDRIQIQVADNGVGIPQENMSRLFTRGFTTRADGHGFGLHSCLLAVRDLGGALTAHSDGPGLGAVFTLELPLKPKGIAS